MIAIEPTYTTTYTHRDGSTSRAVLIGLNTYYVSRGRVTVGRICKVPTNVGVEIKCTSDLSDRYNAGTRWAYAPSFLHAVGQLIGSPVKDVTP